MKESAKKSCNNTILERERERERERDEAILKICSIFFIIKKLFYFEI